MKLFLSSSVNVVASQIANDIGKTGLQLAFIYTAAEVERNGKDADWCQADRAALVNAGFLVTDYTISDKQQADLIHDLSEFNVIFLSGGNTFYLLQQSQQSGFIPVIQNLIMNQQKIYIGSSAGSCIAGPDISPIVNVDDRSKAPDIEASQGYSFVNFCILPHWGSEHFKESYLNNRLDFTYTADQYPLLTLTDTQYVKVTNDGFSIRETK
jgi:dipeptidase E